MVAPTTGWKLTNHHKTYLSVQCDILCNCCSFSSYNISLPNDSCCIISFLGWSGFGMLLLHHVNTIRRKFPSVCCSLSLSSSLLSVLLNWFVMLKYNRTATQFTFQQHRKKIDLFKLNTHLIYNYFFH